MSNPTENKENKKFKYVNKIINLGSSSKGNSIYLELNRKSSSQPFKMLIEVGFDYKTLMERLLKHGISLNEIDAILVTHEHLDHSESVPILFNLGKKIYAPESVFTFHNLKYEEKNIMKEYVEKTLAEGIKVFGIPLEHVNSNGTPCYNLGYIITIEKNYRIAFFTDTKYIKQDLSKFLFNMIFIEANNKRSILEFGIKHAEENNDRNKLIHFKRVLQSHMLVENTGKTLNSFNLNKTDAIFLIHLTSDTKKNEREFIEIVKKYLNKKERIPKILVADHRGNFIS